MNTLQRSATTSRALRLTAFFIEFLPRLGNPVDCQTTSANPRDTRSRLPTTQQFECRNFSALHMLKPFSLHSRKNFRSTANGIFEIRFYKKSKPEPLQERSCKF